MFKVHFRRILFFGILGIAIALGLASMSPPIYEGRTELVVGNPVQTAQGQFTDDIQRIVSTGLSQNPITELNILRGSSVFYKALQRVAERRNDPKLLTEANFEDLYLKYDVLAEKDSGAAQIRARAYSPEIAMELANEIAYSYNDLRQASAKESVQKASFYIDEQIKQGAKNLADAEEKLRDFKQKAEITTVGIKAQQLAQQLAGAQTQLDQVRVGLAGLERETNEQRDQFNATKEDIQESSSQGKSAVLAGLEQQRLNLMAQRKQILVTRLEDAPEVQSLDEQIALTDRQIAAEKKKNSFEGNSRTTIKNPIRRNLEQTLKANEARLNGLRSQEASQRQVIDDLNAKLAKVPADEMEVVRLERDFQLFDNKYRIAKAQAEQLKDRVNAIINPAEILAPARENKIPVAPSFPKSGFFGLLAGVAAGLLFSFGIEALRQRVYTSTQLGELTGLPVVATVPALPRGVANRMLGEIGNANASVMEGYRYLAFATLARREDRPKKVLFTGTGGRVGTSSAASQYAVALARTGLRVVLVDTDTRDRTVSKIFNLEGKPGITDLLSKSMLGGEASDPTQGSQHETLRVIPVGTGTGSAMLDAPGENYQALFDALLKNADMVVLDAAACDVFADASRLAPYMDEVNVVVSATSTSYRNIPIAYDILRRSGAGIVNLVLTHANPQEEAFSRPGAYLATRS